MAMFVIKKDLNFLKKLNYLTAKKTLIRGNHDKVFTQKELNPYFDTIVEEGNGIVVDAGGIDCYVTHYPTEGREYIFNLVGHIHSAWKYQLNMFNVGIDVNNFKPINLDKIPFHFKAITEFYDRDVWVAYDKINANYFGTRGKQNTYFRPD